MTIKRFFLGLLTVLAIALVGISLLNSWNQPQIQSRLELYQTNLQLNAAEYKVRSPQSPVKSENSEQPPVLKTFTGEDSFKAALQQYEKIRESTQTTVETTRTQFDNLALPVVSPPEATEPPTTPSIKGTPSSPEQEQLQKSIVRMELLLNELDLRIGVLQAHLGQTEVALKTWNDLGDRLQPQQETTYETSLPTAQLSKTARVLLGLWNEQPRILPDAEDFINKNLDGWFRYRALTQLYQLQERADALTELQTAQQSVAEKAVVKLAIIIAIPGLGFFLGLGLLIFLVGQRLVKGKESILAQNEEVVWETPWDGETVWQVLIGGFFFVGQVLLPYFLLPLVFGLLKLNPVTFDPRTKAFYILATYVVVASGGLLVLYLSVKQFLPLSKDWFRFDGGGKWFFWGLGGYCVALPLVIVVSLINQQIWQGRGGSNPILPIALEGKDNVALGVFFLTASVAAPVFEEIMFRGFLLPSLTRYLSVTGAIAVSSLIFAIAHLSLSEVLPLTVLGMVLGFVYTRSRNLFAPMFLHCLWNSGTLMNLFILGSSAN